MMSSLSNYDMMPGKSELLKYPAPHLALSIIYYLMPEHFKLEIVLGSTMYCRSQQKERRLGSGP